MARYTSCLLVVLALVIHQSASVAVEVAEKNQLEPIKPSPVDERLQLPEEKAPQVFDSTLINESGENNHAKRDNGDKKNADINEDDKNKRVRGGGGGYGRLTERDKLNCCGNRFESSSRLESTQMTTRSPDANRYSDRYGNRPDDRYNWHAARPTAGSTANNYPGGNTDRFGVRPSYPNSDIEYSRPGAGNVRPTGARPSYGYGNVYGGGGYGDNGAYGSQGYGVSHRPGSIQFGNSGNRPHGYGIHGIIGEQEEVPEGADLPPNPTNIHTQKAVALKALAGVALIGAAAALAANPALIPVGAVLAGRKRRSTREFNLLQFPEQFIRDHVPQIYEDDQVAKEFWNSRHCVARIACEIQKEYVSAIRKDPTLQETVKRQLAELINSDILSADYVRQSMKMLSKVARNSNKKAGKCSIFTCKLFVP